MRRTANDDGGWLWESALNERSIIGFKGSEGGLEQLALRDDDDVEPRRDLVTPENLSYQSFSQVSLYRAAQFLRRRDPQPAHGLLVREKKQGEKPAVDASPPLVNVLEFRPPTNPFRRAEADTPG